jgi:CCR4-NOT transcription complex subunit 1
MPTKTSLVRGILNQVRFPNLITVFYIKLMSRALFDETDTQVQTLLVKAIMERMKMEKPHPWGLIFVTNQMKQRKKKLTHLNLSDIA